MINATSEKKIVGRDLPFTPVTSTTVETMGQWLDHPEGVAVDVAGRVYAGGDAGQIYRFDTEGRAHEVACAGGFVLGLAMDVRLSELHGPTLRGTVG